MNILKDNLYHSGELQKRAELSEKLLKKCTLCPRNCSVDRLAGEHGYCKAGQNAVIASYSPHFGEEQPLVGKHGSGTIFFGSCSLGCCFCQNFSISHHPEDLQEADANILAAIMLDLQKSGCHNINFVTPGHFVPQILAALVIAVKKGLSIPLIYNSSGYENTTTIDLLDGIMDIYMPDFKFWNPALAKRYADAADYPDVARKAISAMYKQVGDLVIDRYGLAARGLLVRHLVMPGAGDDTRRILEYIATTISANTYINIMDQYRPSGTCNRFEELNHPISRKEYNKALESAEKAGLKRIDRRNLAAILKNLGII